jgi:lysyl-tRNA synthetase class 2
MSDTTLPSLAGRPRKARGRSTRPRLPAGNRLLAALVLAAAAINGLFALAVAPSSRFEIADPTTHIDDRLWAAMVAAALVPLGWGVLRRRRGAWMIGCAVLAGTLAVDLAYGEPPTELLLPAVALAVLLLARRRLVAAPYRETLRAQTVPTREAMVRTQELLDAYATDSMAPFKLREDVGHLFSRAGDAVLAFRVENRALLVAGDPIGSPEGVADVIGRARRLARGAGLRFGIVAASEALSDRMRSEFGMRPVYLGCEAIVDASSFTLTGHKIKKVRQAHARVQREGFALECKRLGDLSDAELAELAACQERGRPPEEEQSFVMAPETYDAHGSDRSIVVQARHREDGHVGAFMVFMPLTQRKMWSLAMQLRDPSSPNGTVDALIAHALLCAQEEGVEELSLNFAAARRYVYEPVHGFWPRVAKVLAYLAMRWTQIDQLRYHNEKFSPTWEQRSVIVEHALEVPHLAFAVIWQEGQLPRPNAFIRPAWPQRSDALPA